MYVFLYYNGYSDGERSTTFFFNLKKRHNKQLLFIGHLYAGNGDSLTTKDQDVFQDCKCFYENL